MTLYDITSLNITKMMSTGVVLNRIFIFVVSDPSILPIWPLLIACCNN